MKAGMLTFNTLISCCQQSQRLEDAFRLKVHRAHSPPPTGSGIGWNGHWGYTTRIPPTGSGGVCWYGPFPGVEAHPKQDQSSRVSVLDVVTHIQ